MAIDKLLQDKREAVLALAARYGASNVRVFGSTARDEAGPESDIDLLVTLEASRSLLDQIALWQDLEDLLGRKVDVVTESALHHAIREQVLREAVPL